MILRRDTCEPLQGIPETVAARVALRELERYPRPSTEWVRRFPIASISFAFLLGIVTYDLVRRVDCGRTTIRRGLRKGLTGALSIWMRREFSRIRGNVGARADVLSSRNESTMTEQDNDHNDHGAMAT